MNRKEKTPHYFPFPGEPTPAWLTTVLRDSGVLPTGEVVEVKSRESNAFNSKTSFLRLRFSAGSPPSAPAKLVLKCSIAEKWAVEAGITEVNFYRMAGEMANHPPVIPPCAAAAAAPDGSRSYLLLVNLSDTHAPPITRDDQISIVCGIPREEHQAGVIDTLARLHAYWWEHPALNGGAFETGFWTRSEERFSRYLDRRQAAWKRLMEQNPDWLPANIRTFYTRLFDRLPAYWERSLAPRFRSHSGLTLVHGDAYFANFLCPRVPETGPAYLVDWQSPSFDLPGYDLANLLAAFWNRAQRSEGEREIKLLHRYLDRLQSEGVAGYDWEDLVRDYQAGLIFWVLMPVQDSGDGAGKEYWWPKMQCLLDAFSDWECGTALVRG